MVKLIIQMPRCCDDCFALDEMGDYPTCRITHTSRGYNFNTREKRMPDCPLIDDAPVEPKKVVEMDVHSDFMNVYYCGYCGNNVTGDNYCSNCGKVVQWNATN